MMLMPGTHSSAWFHYMSGKHPGKLGWLVGPSAVGKSKYHPWVPLALDNDAFIAWKSRQPWGRDEWLAFLSKIESLKILPLWSLVPDSVGNRMETLRLWGEYSPVVKSFGFATAFAVQDRMTVGDVPKTADVVFVGGTSGWKWRTVETWAKNFPRVHVGRVNSFDRLLLCEDLGVESVDGTTWFRDPSDKTKLKSIEAWLCGRRENGLKPQMMF